MPIGMGALAIFLLVRGGGGSYSTAGLAVGASTVAGCIGAPLWGRLVDRLGQTRVLVPVASTQVVMLVLLASVAPSGGSLLFLLCGLYGFAAPPIAASMRATWATLLPERGLLVRAFSLDSTAQEVIWIFGPVLSAGLAGAFGPRIAIYAMALFRAIGVAWFASTTVSRTWRSEHPGDRHLLGPLRAGPVRRVLLATLGLAFAWGSLELTIAAFADKHGDSAGPLLAIWAIGSVIGGLGFAARPSNRSPQQLLAILLTLNTLGFIVLMAADRPLTLGILLLVTGIVNAPVIATLYVLIESLAPAGTVTEAFTWVSTTFLVGISGGVALAGVVADTFGPQSGFMLALIGGSVAVTSVVVRRSGLYPAGDLSSTAS